MRKVLILILSMFCLVSSMSAQEDSMLVSIQTAGPKAKAVSIDLTNPEEVDLALRKIHTFKFLESVRLEGDAEDNNLKKLFYRLATLKSLNILVLKEIGIQKIPENISGLKSLRILTIEGCSELDYNDLCQHLKDVPLLEINLIDNDLKKSPQLSFITSLKKVLLSGSLQLDYADLVDQLSKLPNLTFLSIPVNYITELPKNIDKLQKLQILDVSNNNLTSLPDQISSLKVINNLSIHGNLLLDPAKDLAKLKGNNIKYLSLDKEISGEDLEQIKKMFPDVHIDFPVAPEPEPETKKDAEKKVEAPPVYSGELTAKTEFRILSNAYLLYPVFFQGLIYNFDTLNFEERYVDLRYENVYQIVNNGSWRVGSFYFRKNLLSNEKPGKKSETWFRFSLNDGNVAANYPELRAFSGLYWVYKGQLTKKQFKHKFLTRKKSAKPNLRPGNNKRTILFNDIRIEFDKNNSLFTIILKTDSGFTRFNAYPMISGVPLEKIQQTYHRRYLLYKKSLLRRSQKFNKELAKNKTDYDQNYKKMSDYAWKELQLRMSNDEKAMGKGQWLDYYDRIIANEQLAIDLSPLSAAFINRALTLKGYMIPTTSSLSVNPVSTGTGTNNFGYKTINADFIDSKTGGKLVVASVWVLDNKNKIVNKYDGSLGSGTEQVTLRQYSSYTLLVELRNGNWGTVCSEELDKQVFEPNRAYQLKTCIFDKNLDVIGDLLKSGLK